jgi:hypothetical protein
MTAPKSQAELAVSGAKVKASVLCPLWVNTRIADSERNRPAELQNDPASVRTRPESEAMRQAFRQLLASGHTPAQIADDVFNGIRDEKSYIINDARTKDGARTRMEEVLAERNPTLDASGLGAGTGGRE